MQKDSVVYLDHNATTPLDPRVFEAMRTAYLDDFGNTASRQHAAGRRAAEMVEEACAELASLIGADPREIVWTSGATESNNLALKGVSRAP
ncbi:MAG: aminotransferase class V-fold PLP-dependent enzyme, partial [Planctomycetota bacterium]